MKSIKTNSLYYIVFFIIVFGNLIIPNALHAQSELIQHLDATIENSIISNENGMVQEWKDQSGNNNHANTLNGNIYKLEDEDELTWLDFGEDQTRMELFSAFGSDSWLNQSNTSNGFCVFVVFKSTNIDNGWNDIIGNSSAVSSGFGLRYSNSGALKAYLGGKVGNGAGIEKGNKVVLAFNYNSVLGEFEFWDSKSKSTLTTSIFPADFSLTDAVTLGSTTNNDRYFQGYIGEVKIFNRTLTKDKFKEEQNHLYFKWVANNVEKDPPNPNPAAFSIPPKGISGNLITMTAATGTDINGPIEYKFTETSGNPGGTSSNWQTNPNYRDGDLQPLTEYSYTVSMRDAYGNVGITSTKMNANTKAHVEPGKENELEYGAYYGYQGWHFAKGDGRVNANDWVHWFESQTPNAASIHGDMWPDLREYDPENLYETEMNYPNGEIAKLYSCFDYSTIDLHIKWMRDYGIKGCAVQRFTSSIDTPNKLEQGDKKIRDVMTACEKYGVKFWIMHDSGQGDEEEYERITNDWKHLVEDLDVLQSPAYTWQNGLPVYGLWGIGVSSRSWSPSQASKILDFYQNGEEKYRTYVCAGVPVNWRTSPPEGWKPVFDRLDMISPWRTIFNDPDKYKSRMQDDLAYCESKGIDYNPVVSPGASTKHLRDGDHMRNWKPRNGGHFLWKQAYEVCKMGSKFMYVAMFDEVDEGTAMYKLVETVEGLPVGADQVPLNEDGYDLASDWYLQIGTEIQKMIEGKIPVTATLPISPETVSTNTFEKRELLKIYPVPANDRIYISELQDSKSFNILNINGTLVLEGTLSTNSINIGKLDSGIYFLKIKNQLARFIKK